MRQAHCLPLGWEVGIRLRSVATGSPISNSDKYGYQYFQLKEDKPDEAAATRQEQADESEPA
jgi:hypothetical protein